MIIEEFLFAAGREINQRYVILEKLGEGFEGEVYLVEEKYTGILRAAKFFFPHKNLHNRTAQRYARMLHRLSCCPLVVHYQGMEILKYRGKAITCLISEYVNADILNDYLYRQPGKRLGIFRGLQLLHALVVGLESMHSYGVTHADLHAGNIFVKRYGLGFDLKLVDMYHWVGGPRVTRGDDICDAIKVFYQAVGGAKYYAKHPKEIKQICMGLKRSLILKKFRTAANLRDYLENIHWETPYLER